MLKFTIAGAAFNFILEILSRRSLSGAWGFFAAKPLSFLCGTLIIALTLSVSLLLSKKIFYTVIICAMWLSFGIVNFIMLSYRVTPFAAVDIFLLRSTWNIIGIYMKPWQIILAVIGIILFVAVLVMLWKKSRRTKIYFRHAFVSVLSVSVALIFSVIGAKVSAAEPDSDDLAVRYDEYGFTYGFSASIFDAGIGKPEDYSEAKVDSVVSSLEKTKTPEKTPNIIFVQLESFIDVNRLKDVAYSENPLPTFTKLKAECASGFISVPAVGAGTVNTEFEVLTQMNIDYFGAGEYPYNSILQTSTCESLCYDLKELGYSACAIHDYYASFYDRNKVFENLGFDEFISLEDMPDAGYNALGWADDSILTKYILQRMSSTNGADFIYSVSVQGHGKYPTEKLDGSGDISVSGKAYDNNAAGFEYYVNQIKEMDDFLAELIGELEKCGEDTVLVLFGDHIPRFGITEDCLKTGNCHQTEYAIWSNFGLEGDDRDLSSYQLASYVFGMLGINNGNLTKIHQQFSDTAGYENMLRLLEYDELYGKKFAYGGEIPYIKTVITDTTKQAKKSKYKESVA